MVVIVTCSPGTVQKMIHMQQYFRKHCNLNIKSVFCYNVPSYILSKKGIFYENFRPVFHLVDKNSEKIEFSIFLLTAQSILRTLIICYA